MPLRIGLTTEDDHLDFLQEEVSLICFYQAPRISDLT